MQNKAKVTAEEKEEQLECRKELENKLEMQQRLYTRKSQRPPPRQGGKKVSIYTYRKESMKRTSTLKTD